jgi:hypothetical protein
MPLHDQEIGVRCTITAAQTAGPIFFEDITNSEQYVSNILQPHFDSINENK